MSAERPTVTPAAVQREWTTNYEKEQELLDKCASVGGPFQFVKQVNPDRQSGTSNMLVIGNKAYLVKELLDSRHQGGQLKYLVGWEV